MNERPGARPGTVYLVGAGPGDPGLLTERGAALLATADVVLHDELVHRALLARVRSGATVVGVGKRGHGPPEKQASQREIDRAIVEHARAGKSVVRLKGGDPFLFGRGSEEAEALVAAGVPFEIVPGVTSPLAAAAYAGMSLTHRDSASSVVFVTATTRHGEPFDFAELAGHRGTVAVFMGVKRLDEVTRALVERAKRDAETPAAILERGTMPAQRVIDGTLGDIAKRAALASVEAPALLIVGEIVRLREKLRWFDNRPLFGKRVLVTRAEHQARATSELLRSRGAEPIEVATISIHPPKDPADVERAISELGRADVVAFTSENGVEAFFEALHRMKRDARAFGNARVASIGSTTTKALASHGIVADLEPEAFVGEALGRTILDDLVARHGSAKGRRVVIPRALVAREALPEMLRAEGAEVEVVPVYETLPAGSESRDRLVALLEARKIDVVLATSPSTIENLCELVAPSLLGHALVACIGEVTAARVRKRGLEPGAIATTSTLLGLVDALEQHFAARG